MKMPMADKDDIKSGGHIDAAVKKDAMSGSGHAPQTTMDARKSAGSGVSAGRMGKACRTLSKMKD